MSPSPQSTSGGNENILPQRTGPKNIDPRVKGDSLTTLAARRLKLISTGAFSSEVREKASLCLLDFLGAAQSGVQGPVAASILQYAAMRAGKPEAFVFGSETLMCAETAAFVNASLAHSGIRDDMHLESCSHIGGMVVSAVLALSQRDRWSGEQIVRGIVGGYEMGALLGTAIRNGGSFNAHFRPSGLIGAFAATSAAIAAENVDEKIAVNALALAVNMAGGINEWAWAGGTEIFIHNGTASRAGIASYDLAHCGIVASDTVLEGRDGLFKAVNAGAEAHERFRTWLETSQVGQGILDVQFKPAPTCNFTQTTTAIAMGMAGEFKSADVDRIKITTTSAAVAYPGCDNAGPLATVVEGKMSIQYGVCAALHFGRLGEEVLSSVNDKNINALIAKCSLATNSQYDMDFKKGLQAADVEVVLKDGTTLRKSAPDVPWLDGSQVVTRFLDEISMLLNAEKAKILLSRCQNLGDVQINGNLLNM